MHSTAIVLLIYWYGIYCRHNFYSMKKYKLSKSKIAANIPDNFQITLNR